MVTTYENPFLDQDTAMDQGTGKYDSSVDTKADKEFGAISIQATKEFYYETFIRFTVQATAVLYPDSHWNGIDISDPLRLLVKEVALRASGMLKPDREQLEFYLRSDQADQQSASDLVASTQTQVASQREADLIQLLHDLGFTQDFDEVRATWKKERKMLHDATAVFAEHKCLFSVANIQLLFDAYEAGRTKKAQADRKHLEYLQEVFDKRHWKFSEENLNNLLTTWDEAQGVSRAWGLGSLTDLGGSEWLGLKNRHSAMNRTLEGLGNPKAQEVKDAFDDQKRLKDFLDKTGHGSLVSFQTRWQRDQTDLISLKNQSLGAQDRHNMTFDTEISKRFEKVKSKINLACGKENPFIASLDWRNFLALGVCSQNTIAPQLKEHIEADGDVKRAVRFLTTNAIWTFLVKQLFDRARPFDAFEGTHKQAAHDLNRLYASIFPDHETNEEASKWRSSAVRQLVESIESAKKANEEDGGVGTSMTRAAPDALNHRLWEDFMCLWELILSGEQPKEQQHEEDPCDDDARQSQQQQQQPQTQGAKVDNGEGKDAEKKRAEAAAPPHLQVPTQPRDGQQQPKHPLPPLPRYATPHASNKLQAAKSAAKFTKQITDLLSEAISFSQLLAGERAGYALSIPEVITVPQPAQHPPSTSSSSFSSSSYRNVMLRAGDHEHLTTIPNDDDRELEGLLVLAVSPCLVKYGTGMGRELGTESVIVKGHVVVRAERKKRGGGRG